MFNRSAYYSITQALKKFRLTSEQLKELVAQNRSHTVHRPHVDMGGYTVDITYIEKRLLDEIHLPLREKKE